MVPNVALKVIQYSNFQKKFRNTTICKKVIWHNNLHKNKNAEKCFLWANVTQVFSWESHETSMYHTTKQDFPKGPFHDL